MIKNKSKQRGYGIDSPVVLDIQLTRSTESRNDRFHQLKHSSFFNIKHNLAEYLDIFKVEKEIDVFFKKFFDENTRNATDNDIVSLIVTHEELERPIYMNAKKRLWDTEDFLNRVFQISQSNSIFLLNGELQIELIVVKEITGEGKRKAPQTMEQFRKKRKAF